MKALIKTRYLHWSTPTRRFRLRRMPSEIRRMLGAVLFLFFLTPTHAQRPNVIFIVADDLNAWAVKEDYPLLKIPAMEKLKKESLVFRNGSCAAPICIPSRASFFSGRYPHNTGAYFNYKDTWVNNSLSTTEIMPECFKRNGYTTWGGGKIFHVDINDGRQEKMFDNKVFNGGFGPFPSKEYFYGGRWFSIKPWDGPDTDFTDVKNADAIEGFLKEEHDKPFFLYYGLYRPHTPYTAPKRFFDMYADSRIPPPPGFDPNDLDDVPETARNKVDSLKKFHRKGMKKEDVFNEMMRAYCAATSFADWNIGRVLEALDNSPYAKNTIVIFVSDNGFHNGSKMHWTKGTLWEQADVVPFMVRLPEKRAAVCEQTVNLIDIYPTLIEYCGLKGPAHQLDGKSMVPVFKNASAAWDRPAVTVYGENAAGIRDQRYRYIRYADGSEELYDHEKDPYEHKNIAAVPAMKPVKQQLAKWVPEAFVKSLGGGPEKKGEE